MRKFHKRYAYLVNVLKKFGNLDVDIIDCACGEGDGTVHLLREGAKVVGVDIDSKLIKIARKAFPGIPFHVAPIEGLPHLDGHFDIFICSETLEHLTKKESKQAAKEILRVLNPNGIVCVTVPENKKVCMAKKLHKQYLDRKSLTNLFDGYEVLHHSVFYKNSQRKDRGNRVVIFRKIS